MMLQKYTHLLQMGHLNFLPFVSIFSYPNKKIYYSCPHP